MASIQTSSPDIQIFPQADEKPERQATKVCIGRLATNILFRLDEQHLITIKTLGFLIHPQIPLVSGNFKIADVGTGTGIWLLDAAKSVGPETQLVGFDASSAAFPAAHTVPENVTFKVQDMFDPFPDFEIGTYDIVSVRFVTIATTRTEWTRAIENLLTLLKPGGWLQWIESCNFALYNSRPGTSRAACQEIYDGLEPFRSKDDVVIGMMMRESKNMRREAIFRDVGLVNVHEDVFSTDRLQDVGNLGFRNKGTKNAIDCFATSLEDLLRVEDSGWSAERISTLHAKAFEEIDKGVYHTLDLVCIIGQKP